ncbi:MAG: hypothetical protein WCP06_01275 [Verrucomicrobiota bacterium]
MRKLILSLLLLAITSLTGYSQQIKINGQGAALYIATGNPEPDAVIQSKEQAVKDAIGRALANESDSLRQQFNNRAAGLLKIADYESRHVLGNLEYRFDTNSPKKIVTAFVSGNLDLAILRDVLNGLQGGEAQVNRSKSKIAIFFTVRETTQASVDAGSFSYSNQGETNKQTQANSQAQSNGSATNSNKSAATTSGTYNSKDASNQQAEGTLHASESGVAKDETTLTQQKGGGSNSKDALSNETRRESTSERKDVLSDEQSATNQKGSVATTLDKKADSLRYKLDATARESFGASVLGRFTDKGFKRVTDGGMFESASLLDEAFGAGNVVPAKVYKSLIAEVQSTKPSLKFLVVGTLDFSFPVKDDLTGMQKISATVTGKVYEMSEGEIELVAALAPITKSASAMTQQDAKKRVLESLPEFAVDEILTKMRNNIGEL